MTNLVLYHNDMSTCAQKVRFVLAEKGLDFDGRHLDLRAGDQHKPDYLKLNPLGVVPTLVVDGRPIIESTVICELIEDLAPAPSLRPADPVDRAAMRLWMKRLDNGMHAETGVMSSAIAFRYQKLDLGEAHARELVENIPDPAKRERMRSIVFEGVQSPLFLDAMTKFDRLLRDINATLQETPWLAGPDFSLADACYAPYMTRLDHLSLSGLWSSLPAVGNWYDRLRARDGYQTGLAAWFNDKYLTLMKEKGEEVWPMIADHLKAA